MREVAVDGHDERRAESEGAAEAGDVRRPESLLSLPVQDLDAGELCLESGGDLARPVRRGVVDDEDAGVEPGVATDVDERPGHPLDVLALVVGRQADDEHGHIIAV